MSVIKTDEDNNQIVLKLDNGDKQKFEQALKEWNFKDEQSILRFVVSLLLESDDKRSLAILKDGQSSSFAPADHLLKSKNE